MHVFFSVSGGEINMSTPSLSGSSKAAEQFEGFWKQLKECHLNALEGMMHPQPPI